MFLLFFKTIKVLILWFHLYSCINRSDYCFQIESSGELLDFVEMLVCIVIDYYSLCPYIMN